MKGIKGTAPVSEASGQPVRASISFPPDIYQTLEEIARQKKVSLAWVVREAAEEYISGKWPLFAGAAKERRP
jgi:predicted DNA-binding protein